MTTVEIIDDDDKILFSETLLKLQMVCTECKKNVGFVYSDSATHSECLGWIFICSRCQVK